MDIANVQEKCCGCSACVSVCPSKAISLEEDKEGFLYPKVDRDKCVKCHLCEKTCFYLSGIESMKSDSDVQYTYAVKAKNDEVRMKSQSGGMFSLLSTQIIKKDGVVYGCILDSDFRAVHSRAETYIERDLMCGSKYVQSHLLDVYKQVKDDLLKNRCVLFSGTPCQVEGLIKFVSKLKKVYRDNLVLVDIVCHGVPSPKIWREYVRAISNEYGSSPRRIVFRDKKYGWHSFVEKIEFDNKNYMSDKYGRIFFNHGAIRKSCFSCKFTNVNRVSDVTIGDCWGIEEKHPELDDDKGISIAIINTRKGKMLFDEIRGEADVVEIDINHYLQPQLKEPIYLNKKNREEFWNTYNRDGIMMILKKYGEGTIREKIERKCGTIISLKNKLIKKFL